MIKKLNHTGKASSLAIMLAAVLLSPASRAQVVTLQDGNSSALVNVNSSAGMSQWLVDGVNNLNQQWFWYSVGEGNVAAPINNISTANYSQSAANNLDTIYANTSYGVEINYTLTGGGAGSAQIAEGITINNTTASALDFHFYQYSAFELLGTPGDSVSMNNSIAYQSKGPSGIAEGIIAPPANEFEANNVGGPNSTLSKLNSTAGLVLDGNPTAGPPGNVTWAFEWDLSIPADSSTIITKQKDLNIQVTPEPSTLSIAGLACGALLLLRVTRFWKKASSH